MSRPGMTSMTCSKIVSPPLCRASSSAMRRAARCLSDRSRGTRIFLNMAILMVEEQGNRALLEHGLGDRAEEKLVQRTFAVGAHDQQACLQLAGVVEQGLSHVLVMKHVALALNVMDMQKIQDAVGRPRSILAFRRHRDDVDGIGA